MAFPLAAIPVALSAVQSLIRLRGRVDNILSVKEASSGHCQSKFVYFAKTSEPDFAVIDFPAFFRVDLSGSMAAPNI